MRVEVTGSEPARNQRMTREKVYENKKKRGRQVRERGSESSTRLPRRSRTQDVMYTGNEGLLNIRKIVHLIYCK